MATGFGDWANSVKIHNLVKKIAQNEVQRLRPASRLAEVMSIDEENKTLGVSFTGETNVVTVPYTSVAPARVGQWVRIGGTTHDRYVEDVIGTTAVESRVNDLDAHVDALMSATAGTDWKENDDGEAPAQGVASWFDNLFGWKESVVSGATGSSAPTTSVDQAAYDATKALYDQNQATALAAANAAAAVQQISQDLNGRSGGLNKLLRFPVSAAVSTTDWSYDPGVFVGSSKGELSLAGSNANGYYSIRSNYTFTTDDQAIAVQLGENANTRGTVLVLRAPTAGGAGVAALVKGNYLAIGIITGFTEGVNNNSFFTTAASVSRTQSSGDGAEFRAVGDSFVLLINGNPVLSYSSPLGTKGASNRSSFIIKQKAQPFLVEYSFNLVSVGLYDYGSAGASVTTRTASRVSRVATTAITVSVNPFTATNFPANFFAVADFTQNMTVDDLGTARIKATSADWYEIMCSYSARADVGQNASGAQGYRYSNISPKWCLIVNGNQVTSGIPAGASIKWPLAANDIVQPAIWSDETGFSYDGSIWIAKSFVLDRINGGPGAFFQVVADV